MALLFKAKHPIHDQEPHRKLTRFKRWHVRDVPEPSHDDGIDPHGNLTRTEHCHVRPKVEPLPLMDASARPAAQPKRDAAADLHATDPISIDVLRKALPLRFASIDD